MICTATAIVDLCRDKSDEIELLHQTHIFWCVYQNISSLIINSGTCFLLKRKENDLDPLSN